MFNRPTALSSAALRASSSALLLATLGLSGSAAAQERPAVTLARMSCGTNAAPTEVGLRFSDTYDFAGLKVQLVYSCYLIQHGDDYLIWDTGFATGPGATAPKQSLVELLGQADVPTERVKFVGISHMHGDHMGQARLFPQATLLIGRGDWEVLSDATRTRDQSAIAPWLGGKGTVEPLSGDKDVFGDGSVVILDMPGHTPGHRSLLVRLPEMGNVLLTGDLAHFHENYDTNGVPTFNTDRAATLASLDRFKQIVRNLNATVIIQHDERDIGKLPAFPAAAK